VSYDLATDQDDAGIRRREGQSSVQPRSDDGASYEDPAEGLAHGSPAHHRRSSSVTPSILQRMQQTQGNRAVRRYLQRSASSSQAGTQDEIAQRIDKKAGGGNSLDTGVQRKLEQGLGADLSSVRVHTGSEADDLARSVDSVAFTTGQDIFFRDGAYDPSSQSGMQLLAHEATHTVQQAAGPVAGTPSPGGISISDPTDEYERAADMSAARVARGEGAGSGVLPSGGDRPANLRREAAHAEVDDEGAAVQRAVAAVAGEEEKAGSRVPMPVLSQSDYEITPVTEGEHAGSHYLVERNLHNTWLFKPDGGQIAREIAEHGKAAPGSITEEHPPGFRVEVAELNGQVGTLLDWTRKDDTLADIRNRDPQLFSELMSAPLKADIDLIAPLAVGLDQRPENLRVNINPATKSISKLEPLDVNAAFPPGPLRDAVLPFLKPGGGSSAQVSGEMLSALQRLAANKESFRRVMEVFFGEDAGRRILVSLDGALAEASEATNKARK
jgi:uncharacterized protein DUF4157